MAAKLAEAQDLIRIQYEANEEMTKIIAGLEARLARVVEALERIADSDAGIYDGPYALRMIAHAALVAVREQPVQEQP